MEKSSKSVSDSRIFYGKILSAHGVKGFLNMEMLTDYPEQFEAGNTVELCSSSGAGCHRFKIEEFREGSGKSMVKFEGISSRNEAAMLSGMYFVKDRSEVPEVSAENRFYKFDLIGLCAMIGPEEIGQIEDVITDGDGVNYLTVTHAGQEAVIPFKNEFIVDIDIENKILRLKNLEGFFDAED